MHIPGPRALACPLARREKRHREPEESRRSNFCLKAHALQPRHVGRGPRGGLEERVQHARVGFTAEVAFRLVAYGEGDGLLVVGIWGVGVGMLRCGGMVGFGGVVARGVRFGIVVVVGFDGRLVVAREVPGAVSCGHAEEDFDEDEVWPGWTRGSGVGPEERG